MAHILGIDAAWTATNPSGIALVSTDTDPPRLLRASPSFEDFVLGTAPEAWCGKHNLRASLRDVLTAASDLGGESIDVVAVDMPLGLKPVRGRRPCDHLVSSAFGGRGCATHTPTVQRPGVVSDAFLRDAAEAGFELATTVSQRPRCALLEVYPHAALLELCDLEYRAPYKLARRHRYWPDKTANDRLQEIRLSWDIILHFLRQRLAFDLTIDCEGRNLKYWKAWEDVIDAIVCCWVGLEWLNGRARPYGDDQAAIWVPIARTDHGEDLARHAAA